MLKLALCVVLFLIVMRIGIVVLRALSQPAPAPPPPGELRKVNLRYRCTICSAELKMTAAAEEDPEPPRHCMEDMQLVVRVE